jgi:hypothetical protein
MKLRNIDLGELMERGRKRELLLGRVVMKKKKRRKRKRKMWILILKYR